MKGLLLAGLLSKREGTGIWAALSVLLLWRMSEMERLDVSTYVIPASCTLGVCIVSIVCAVIFGFMMRAWLHERAADNKAAEGKIESTKCLPYDRRYDFGTVAGMLVGAAMGIAGCPLLVDLFLVNAGPIWYYLAAGVIAAIGTVFWVMAFHCGLRLTIIRAKDYIFDINDVLKEVKEEVEDEVEGKGEDPKP